MNRVTKEQIGQFKSWVKADWPEDRMLQEIHLVRLIRQEEMRCMSDAEIIAYYEQVPAKRTAA